MRRLRLTALVALGVFIALSLGVSCSQKSRLPSPSQQAVGLYKGELAIVNEMTGDTLESQGGITLRVDPMEPGIVRFSLIKLRFANVDVGDVYLDANIARLNDTYLVMSAYNKEILLLHNTLTLSVYLNGWQEVDDIHLTVRTTALFDSSPHPQDVVITYVGSR